MPFPPLPWWGAAAGGSVALDVHENYQKRSFRNRFMFVQATGPVTWTLPVERRGGVPRGQDLTRRVGGDADRKTWQAIRTAYGRAPYFEEMATGLEALFLGGPEMLGSWNRASIRWAADWLGVAAPPDAGHPSPVPVDHEAGEENRREVWSMRGAHWPHVWADRQSDLPFSRLSVLDALLHLGPEASMLVSPR